MLLFTAKRKSILFLMKKLLALSKNLEASLALPAAKSPGAEQWPRMYESACIPLGIRRRT